MHAAAAQFTATSAIEREVPQSAVQDPFVIGSDKGF